MFPSFGYVVLGNGEERRFRLDDYLAYYRHLKARFLESVGAGAFERLDEPIAYPWKCRHCGVCAWNAACKQQRTDDDHLSLVAWMRRDQIGKLEAANIRSLRDLAHATDDSRPSGMAQETFVKLRRQASLQARGREASAPIYELLAHEPPLGFAMMPHPARGDVFFDMEGDPLYEPGQGLQYLFGCWMPDDMPQFRAFWGTNRTDEKRAFEAFVDFIVARRRHNPEMHVYHYSSYERSALRTLAQVHCTRENEVDDLLRGEVLVDLFPVVRQAVAISEDGYGLKKLERFYDLERATDVKKGDQSIVMFERWIAEHDQRILDDIEAYNRDDCRSTYLLREWLLERRREAIETFGTDLPLRGVKNPDEPCHAELEPSCAKCAARQKEQLEEERRSDLERALLHGVLAPQTEQEYRCMASAKRERYLMANLLAYHRREDKRAWWEYYDRCDNVDDLVEFDKHAIGALRLRDDIPPYAVKKSAVYAYDYPPQPHKLAAGDDVHDPRTRKGAGTIVSIDDEANRLELKTTASFAGARAVAELIPAGPPSTGAQRKALARIGQSLLAGTLASERPATYDLLSNGSPRVASHGGADGRLQPERVTADSVSAVVQSLESSYLFIQGPPGSGKTTVGSQVICELLALGKRVAVTSTSHKAIHNLLHAVEGCTIQCGRRFRGRYKHTAGNAESEFRSRLASPFIESASKNETFDGDDYQLAGGTGWLFAREALAGTFDYLFIDEAGQVSLADALAVSACAKNVVLLGDPSQLAQVSQGRHPIHVGDSVLAHLLGDERTVAPDRGIFLDVSYRMQPEICSFVSATTYEGRLAPAEDTQMHRVVANGHELAGLSFVPVVHAGNSASSVEEADEIVRRIALLRDHGTVVDSHPRERRGLPRPLDDRDVIVVTPYNAQRRLIASKLRNAGIGVKVGTVDKFQGQEAAVVFYSMATSSGDDVPRDMEFLFERNRFNVAISRARAASVLVCSPRLLDVSCRTPEEMALANLLCAFAERCADAPRAAEPVPA